MNEFEFPANIKQIGSIHDGIKIYMEDYVCSFLQQYAAVHEEAICFLVGRNMVIDSQEVLFINGAVKGVDTIIENGINTFTIKSWEHANREIERYFESCEIVGFMVSQPGYGTFLNMNYANYHIENFKKLHQVIFIVDPIEKVNAFYIYNDTKDDVVEASGYFIYYDKNENMHEYMLHNRIRKLKVQENVIEEQQDIENQEDDTDKKEEVVSKIRNIYRGRASRPNLRTEKNKQEPKRLINMLVSLSAVLFVICFIMGAGLMQNEGRIGNLEDELIKLNTSYKNLLVQIKQTNATSVFAATDGKIQTEQPIETSAPVIKEDGNLVLKEEINTPKPTEEDVAETVKVVVNDSTIPETYTVQQGDSLGYISMKFYGTSKMADKIMEINKIDNPDKIYFGKVLKLPRP